MFSVEKGGYHKLYNLRRGNVACFRDDNPLKDGKRQEANKEQVMFRGQKEDQGRKGAILVRTNAGVE